MAGYFTNFSDETVGVAPSDWSILFGTGRTITIVDNSANGHGKCLRVEGTGNPANYGMVKYDPIDSDPDRKDFELLALVRDLDGYAAVAARGQANSSALVCGMKPGPDAEYGGSLSAGVLNQKAEATTNYRGTDWFWIRVRQADGVDGSPFGVQYKTWPEGTEEPFEHSTWSETVAVSAGAIGFLLETGRNSQLEVAVFSVTTGVGAGRARSVNANNAMSLCRFLLNEAESGTAPTTAADDTGHGNDLTLDYSSGDLEWTSVPAGRGLDFLAPPITSNSAIARLDNIVANGNLGTELDGENTFWFAMVLSNIAGHSYGCRLFAIGTSSGNTDISIIKEATDLWAVRFDNESGGSGHLAKFYFDPGDTNPHTLVIQIDMDELGPGSRIRIMIDGEYRSISQSNFAATDVLGRINSPDRILSLGNRGSLNRNVQGQIFYAEMGKGVLTEEQLESIHTQLLADNDSAWLVASGPEPVALDGVAEQASSLDGSLVLGLPKAGVASTLAEALGALSISVPVAGTSSSLSEAEGVLRVVNELALAGAVEQPSSAGGRLVVGVLLGGLVYSDSAAYGRVSVATPMAGTVDQASFIGGALQTIGALSGTSTTHTEATGTMGVSIPLAGSSSTLSQFLATLETQIASALTGVVEQSSVLEGSLSLATPLAGVANTISEVVGFLVPDDADLHGLVETDSVLEAALRIGLPLRGVAEQETITEPGTFSIALPLGGVSTTSSRVEAARLILNPRLNPRPIQTGTLVRGTLAVPTSNSTGWLTASDIFLHNEYWESLEISRMAASDIFLGASLQVEFIFIRPE